MPLTENQQTTTPRIQGPAAQGKENAPLKPAGAPVATAATTSGVLRRLPRRSRTRRRGRSRGRSQRRG